MRTWPVCAADRRRGADPHSPAQVHDIGLTRVAAAGDEVDLVAQLGKRLAV